MATPVPGTNRTESPRKRLPIYRAGGSEEPTFTALRAKELEIAAEVAAMDLDELRRWPLLSCNAKTSVSLDFPIGHTCDPTATCARVCYAAGPRAAATWRKSLRKRLRNLRYFRLEEPHEAAWQLGREFRRARRRWEPRANLDYLRINGSGELFPEMVPVLNFFASYYGGIRLWIVTRRPELAAQIAPLPNVYLQLSLDASTPPELVERSRFLATTHPRAYLSFLRTAPKDRHARGGDRLQREAHGRASIPRPHGLPRRRGTAAARQHPWHRRHRLRDVPQVLRRKDA